MNKNAAIQHLKSFASKSVLIEDVCAAYCFDIYGLYSQSQDIYENILNKSEVIKINLIEAGFVLFGVAEHVRITKDSEFLYRHSDFIDVLVSLALEEWRNPCKNIFGDFSYAINTSTLGIVYGGLFTINNFIKKDDISLTIKEIKDYIFKNNILKNVLVNNSKDRQVSSDILLSVMPFGMFSPEDLVLVEAVKEMERKLNANGSIKRYVNSDMPDSISTLMLSWYYSEKGDFGKAKVYLKAAECIEINNIYEIILYLLIIDKLESSGHIGDFLINHNPYGNYNRYKPGKNERHPKVPREGETVRINAITWPANKDMEVKLNLYANGKRICDLLGEYVEDESENFWQWEIGPFKSRDHVEYNICIEDEKANTDSFSFDVLTKSNLKVLKSVEFKEGSLFLTAEDDRGIEKNILFTPCEGEVLYIGTSKTGYKSDNSAAFAEESTHWSLCWGSSSLKINRESLIISFYCDDELIFETALNRIITWYEDNNGNVYETECSIKADADEKFYGFGERFNSISQEGNTPDCYVYNQYKDQGIRTYMPVPFFISSSGYGIYVDSSSYIAFDMRVKENKNYSFRVRGNSFIFAVIPGKPKDVIRKFTDITGKPSMLPKWAFGPWMSSNNWDNQNEVLKQVELTKKYEIPASVLVIEAWSDEATYYIFNDAEYMTNNGEGNLKYDDYRFPDWGRWPDPKRLVEYLHNSNIKCILWQIPVIKYMNGLHHPQKDMDEEYAIKNKYCVLNNDGTPYRIPEGWFKGSLILDFSNPEASKWWFEKRKYLIEDIGVDGFKTDGGEFVFGEDLRFYSGKTGLEMRNLYPNEYIKSYYDFINKHNPKGGITFSRAGFTGAQKFPAHWAGDERSTFKAFKNSIIAGLTSGMSGISFWGWDFAGFSGEIPTAELYIRAAEMAAFCPIMQYHAESKAEFNQDRTPWNIAERTGDERVLEIYRYYANLRMNLIPYMYNEALKSSRTGIPMMRALLLEYPEDESCFDIYDEYMFGDSLLVCPVTDSEANSREVYLPEGKWIGFRDGKVYEGCKKTVVDAPVHTIPVFVKYNSIAAFNLNDCFEFGGKISNDLNSYENLCFRIYGDTVDNYVFEDDLGNCITINVKNCECMVIDVKNNRLPVFIIMDKCIKDININGSIIDKNRIMELGKDVIAIKVDSI